MNAMWVVLALIVANQAGVPVFAAPALLGLGALAWNGDVNVVIALIGAVGAALCADLSWYGLGRWRGAWVLGVLRRFSPRAGAFADDARRAWLSHDRMLQLGARFLPELNPIAAALAGTTRISLRRFVVGAGASTAIWAGTWMGAGYLIGAAVAHGGGGSLETIMLTLLGVVVATAPFVVVFALLAWTRRRRRLDRDAAARQIALTDVVHERLGAAVAPVVRLRRRTWQVRIAVPFERPGMIEALLAIVLEAFAPRDRRSLEIVLTRQADGPATNVRGARGVRGESLSWT